MSAGNERPQTDEDTKPEIEPSKDAKDTRDVKKCDKVSLKDVLPQIWVSSLSLSTVILVGINMAFSGVLLPQLAADPKIHGFTKVEASWIASIASFSGPVGSFIAGPLMDRFGRRTICIFQNIPFLICWVIIYFTTESLWPLYLARLMSGMGGGLAIVGVVYTAEIAHLSYRPILLSLNSVNIALGILITTVFGVYLEWHLCAVVFGVFAFVCLLLTLLLPESPYWMATFTDASIDDISVSVKYLNRNEQMFTAELQRIQDAIIKKRQQESDRGKDKNWFQEFGETLKLFKDRTVYKPMFIIIIIFALQQTAGTYIVIYYTLNIFRSIDNDYGYGFNGDRATIVLGVLRFIMSFVSTGCSKVMGRRSIMLTSATLMAITITISSGLLHLNGVTSIDFSGNVTVPNSSSPKAVNDWWIVISILAYVCAGAFGLMVIPWVIISELLPTKVRGFGTGLMVSYAAVLSFFVIKLFPFMIDLLSLPGVFLSYGIMSFIMILYIYFCLPETFGKSFEEISNKFVRKPKDLVIVSQ